MRALEEQADIVRRAAARSRRLNTPRVASRHDQRADEIMRQAEVIRDLLDELAAVRQEAESAGE